MWRVVLSSCRRTTSRRRVHAGAAGSGATRRPDEAAAPHSPSVRSTATPRAADHGIGIQKEMHGLLCCIRSGVVWKYLEGGEGCLQVSEEGAEVGITHLHPTKVQVLQAQQPLSHP